MLGQRLSTLLAFLFLVSTGARSEVLLNEFLATNRAAFADPDRPGEFDDWIELHNSGEEDIDLEGWSLADHPRATGRWPFPEGTSIAGGGYLLVWADNEPEEGPLHAEFRLRSSGEVLSLMDPGGVVVDALSFGPQTPDLSFGRPSSGEGWCVLGSPTPGAPNTRCSAGPVDFSRPSGTFTEDFLLELSTELPGAVLRYSLDGSEPDAVSGIAYSEPLPIGRTLRLRVRAFAEGREPGPIASGVWVKLARELGDFDSNLPLVVLDSFGIDIDAVSDPDRPRPFRPVVSVFLPVAEETGRASLLGSPDWVGPGGMHVRGQSTTQYPKRQYAFEAWDEADRDLDIEIFGLPREGDWILQAPYSDKTLLRNWLMYRWSNRIGRYAVRTRFVEVFYNDRGSAAVERRDYRGVYVLMEKIERGPDRVDLARLDPADDAEPEISGGYLLKRDWLGGAEFFRTRVYRDGLIWVDPPRRELTRAQADWIEAWVNDFESVLSGPDFADPERGYAAWIDVDSFIDHHLLVELGRNVDGFVLSTYLSKDRGRPLEMGPIWDYNGALGGADYFCAYETEGWHHEFDERDCNDGSEIFPADNPNGYRWYARLFEDPAFRQRYAERWVELRSSGLATDWLLDDLDLAVARLRDAGARDNPVDRNFERWDILNRRVWPNFFVRGTYEEHVEWLRTWLRGRVAWMDSALVPPPAFSHPGGRVEEGFLVGLSGEGEIWFTLNGPDPRSEDGTPDALARLYREPLAIRENTRIRARIRLDEGTWSELVEGLWVTRVPELVVSEILYDPAGFEGDRFLRSRYEFIELLNAGEEPIELAGFRLLRVTGETTALRFDLSASAIDRLEPGGLLVIPRHEEAFRERYGLEIPIAGAFSGSYRDAGDTVLLEGPLGEPIVRFDYDADWFEDDPRRGWSLTLRDPEGDPALWNLPEAWRPSRAVGGSPGRLEGAAPRSRIGDFNRDRSLDVSDAVATLGYLFGGREPPCASDASDRRLLDTNGDGFVNLSDPVHTLTWLFRGGEAGAIDAGCVEIDGCGEACAGELRP